MHRNAFIGSLRGITKRGIKNPVHRTLPRFNISLPLRQLYVRSNVAKYLHLMKSCPRPLALGQPDHQTKSEVIIASFKWEILDGFQSENICQSGKGWGKLGQINKRMPSCFDVSYPYLSIPIRTYPYPFPLSLSFLLQLFRGAFLA